MIVGSKARMYELFQDGSFGNRVRSWLSFKAYEDDGMPCSVGIRYRDPRGGAGPFVPNIEPQWVSTQMLFLTTKGWSTKYMVLGEATPNDRIVLQGELVEEPHCGYALHYSTVKANMRDALKQAPRNHLGPGALLILKAALDASSYADMRALLDRYPGATIEFTCYETNVGIVPGRNTVIWEVRHY